MNWYFTTKNMNEFVFGTLSLFFMEFCWIDEGKGAKILYQNNFHHMIKSLCKQWDLNEPEDQLYTVSETDEVAQMNRSSQHAKWCWLLAVYKDFVFNISEDLNAFA